MWEEIDAFMSPGEYKRFVRYIEKQVEEKTAEEIDPNPDFDRYAPEWSRWFRDLETGEIWRLAAPDYPFKGRWKPLKKGNH